MGTFAGDKSGDNISSPGVFTRSQPGADGFTLWFRATRRAKWGAVATAASYREAVALIGCGDRRGGDWYIGPARGG